MALTRHGEATLLWVVIAERDRTAGMVEVVMPGLLKRYIDRFAPDDNAHDLCFNLWLLVHANAYVLARLQGQVSKGCSPASEIDAGGLVRTETA